MPRLKRMFELGKLEVWIVDLLYIVDLFCRFFPCFFVHALSLCFHSVDVVFVISHVLLPLSSLPFGENRVLHGYE